MLRITDEGQEGALETARGAQNRVDKSSSGESHRWSCFQAFEDVSIRETSLGYVCMYGSLANGVFIFVSLQTGS